MVNTHLDNFAAITSRWCRSGGEIPVGWGSEQSDVSEDVVVSPVTDPSSSSDLCNRDVSEGLHVHLIATAATK